MRRLPIPTLALAVVATWAATAPPVPATAEPLAVLRADRGPRQADAVSEHGAIAPRAGQPVRPGDPRHDTPQAAATAASAGPGRRDPGATTRCVAVELTAWGRPGHGASVDLHTSTHRLIRALDRLLALAGEERGLGGARITGLSGGPAINVKPATAWARIELEVGAATTDGALRRELAGRLGELASLSLAPCAAAAARAGGE